MHTFSVVDQRGDKQFPAGLSGRALIISCQAISNAQGQGIQAGGGVESDPVAPLMDHHLVSDEQPQVSALFR